LLEFILPARRRRAPQFKRTFFRGGGKLFSETSLRLRTKALFSCALFLAAICIAASAARAGHTAAQAPAPSQVPTQPPGPVNLDALGAKKLPDGPGKQIVETSCKDCHTFDRITMAHHSLTHWHTIVREMEQKGANVDPGDVGPLVQYLATNFGLRHTHTSAKPPIPAPSHPPSQ
jgi:cytochrome c5